MPRTYRLGRRQAAVDQTADSILTAARDLVAEGEGVSVGAIARRAGVSRITIYNRFGSRSGLLEALVPHSTPADPGVGDPRAVLRQHLERTSNAWSAHPALFRHLPPPGEDFETGRRIAASLAAADSLRPGCSLREAEDVIGALSSFAVFDRLHKDGRRSPAAVSEILIRLAAGILA